jgi:hypothetical protein
MVAIWGTTNRPVTNLKMTCPMCHQQSSVGISQEVSYGTALLLITLHFAGDKYYGHCNHCGGIFQFSNDGVKWLRENKISLSYWKWNVVGCMPIPALILFFNLLSYGIMWALFGVVVIIILLGLMFFL